MNIDICSFNVRENVGTIESFATGFAFNFASSGWIIVKITNFKKIYPRYKLY